MTEWRDPAPERPPQPRDEDERDEREPDMRDPEAQRAPGDESHGGGRPGESPPPMQAGSGEDDAERETIPLDADGIGYQAVGRNNIREGRVGGVMGTPHAGRGQGQGS